MRKKVAISMGDPLGIGPEVVAQALADGRVRAAVEPLVFGDAAALRSAAALYRVAAPQVRQVQGGALAFVNAALDAVLAGEASALCTAPLSKERVARSEDPRFVGHTEHLAVRCGTRVAMMMAGPRLRVVLASNHLALAEVPRAISSEQIAFVTQLAASELRARWGIEKPRIAVCGLNPHAGEGGIFGDEEARIVAPAIAEARAAGVDASGPHAADGLFPRAMKGAYDAVVALYHDQGLIPAKLLDFRETVNVTLGLPFPRTSPDHGTADDIAGQGKADPEPMISALLLAARLAQR
jgi:4-hydroxythreonine-4-phosphate dehydrogenase